ncbi:MAG: signal peptidase I [Candidatus Pacebacteria bacterium]|nr:signal peptidase I [Candidatus Paceibacterota bacterium]
MNKFLEIFLETLKIFLIALAITIPVRYFLFQPFFVSGASMEPTFSSGDYLLVDEISYRFRDPQRGEVVVFKRPNAEIYLIKRVVGLPFEEVEISDNKIIIKNKDFPQGFVLDEPYINQDNFFKGGGNDLKIVLGEKEYFVLGDNRDHSSDSREFGAVKRDRFIGRVWLSFSTEKGIDFFSVPQYSYNQ